MSRVVELRSDSDRYILLLRAPLRVYRTDLEGHQQQRFEAQMEKFLTGATPESALRSESKFPAPVRQLKDRGGNVRALGVWCQGDGYDLYVVQAIYDKHDENEYLPKQYMFAERGTELTDRLDDLTRKALSNRVSEWRSDSDLLVFTPGDL